MRVMSPSIMLDEPRYVLAAADQSAIAPLWGRRLLVSIRMTRVLTDPLQGQMRFACLASFL
jgi:hypothetical protein